MILTNKSILSNIIILFIATAHAENSSNTINHPKCACQKQQITFAMIKPEAVKAGKTGDIVKHIELNGFTIKDMIKKDLEKQDVELFYKEHKDKPFFKDLVTYITSGPVILLALEKENAVNDWRKLMGPTDPNKADLGTIRKMFGKSIQENAVHGSANIDDAKNELAFLEKQKIVIV